MRRFFCCFIIFIAFISLFSPRVFAEEQADEQGVSPEVSSEQKDNDFLPQNLLPASVSEQPSLPILTSNSSSPSVSGPETTPDIVAVTLNTSSALEYVELYNQSETPVDMSQMTMRVTAGTVVCEVGISDPGWLLVQSYLLLSSSTIALQAHRFSRECVLPDTITRFELFYRGSRQQLVDGITNGAWLRHTGAVKTNTKTSLDCSHKPTLPTLKQTGSVKDYVKCSGLADLFSGALYAPAINSSLKIIEVFPNARSCSPMDQVLDCSDYIKVRNTSSQPVNLANFRVRSGSKYSNATVSSSFNWQQPTLNPERDELVLPGGQSFLLRLRNDGQPLSLPASDGTIWIEDYYGVKTYDEVTYTGMDLAAARMKSWAYDQTSQQWKLGIPSPGGDNAFPEDEPGKGNVGALLSDLKPCRDDQYRSEETNRCRSLSSASVLVPCKEGQYRSEETNRCRSIVAAAAAALKPCADDQFRSLLTNRCRKIASSEDVALADCGEGRERNPETHRCRNVKNGAVPDAAFAVSPLKETGKAFVGWWALGGIGMLALAYGIWEWRSELLSGIRKTGAFFSSKK